MEQPRVTLVICDGMGLSAQFSGNAIANALTPTLDYLLATYPSMRLLAAGSEVGLDLGEPGNSEVGHLTIGTGQVMSQAFQIINSAIKSETYKSNKVFLTAIEKAKKNKSTLHIVGMISRGGVHGHIDHLIALLQLAQSKGVARVAVHAITDGRDTASKVAIEEGKKLLPLLALFEFGVIACVGGRYWGMDRDNNWERTDLYYWAMRGRATHSAFSLEAAIGQGYDRGEDDEVLQPTVIVNQNMEPVAPINQNDVVMFTNYRPDRIRQLATRVITTPLPLSIVTMTDYFLAEGPPSYPSTTVYNAYPLPRPDGTLAEAFAGAHKTQLHIAETEKYAHVTYFFNGHQEVKKPHEEWMLIPSVKVRSFDSAPDMSAYAVTSAFLMAYNQHRADFTVVNYANMDMVGHTGNYEATLQAVTCVDSELKRVVEAIEGGTDWLIITADHGNAEQMINPQSGEVDKEHTSNPVPFILVQRDLRQARGMTKNQLAVMSQVGMLADVAPTIIDIMELRQPRQMTGTSLRNAQA
jgi:2,3-bisphosphoglycerate-independent phosphoglycerate mutase